MTATTTSAPPKDSVFAIGDAESAGTRAHLGPRCWPEASCLLS